MVAVPVDRIDAVRQREPAGPGRCCHERPAADWIQRGADWREFLIHRGRSWYLEPPVGDAVMNTDPSHYFGAGPSLRIVKSSVNYPQTPPGTTLTTLDTVDYEYLVSNTGNVILTGVVESDAFVDALVDANLLNEKEMDRATEVVLEEIIVRETIESVRNSN